MFIRQIRLHNRGVFIPLRKRPQTPPCVTEREWSIGRDSHPRKAVWKTAA